MSQENTSPSWWLVAVSVTQAAKTDWQNQATVAAVLAEAKAATESRLAGPFASYEEAETAWRGLAWQSVDDADLCWRIVRG